MTSTLYNKLHHPLKGYKMMIYKEENLYIRSILSTIKVLARANY